MNDKQYLFFDIECCDGVHICTFGYVLADKDLNIIEKKDIIINPEKPFPPGFRRTGFVEKLGYPIEIFSKCKNFVNFEKEIKQLMYKKNTVLVGHAVSNDFNFLIIACERYGLDPLDDCVFFDTQLLHRQFTQSERIISLESIIQEIGIDMNAIETHKSDDDAFMSLLTLKYYCEKLDKSPDELFEIYNQSKGLLKDNVVYLYDDNLVRLFYAYIVDYKSKNLSDKFKDKIFSFEEKLIRENTLKIWTLIEYIIDNGGCFVRQKQKSTVFIYSEEKLQDDVLSNEENRRQNFHNNTRSIDFDKKDEQNIYDGQLIKFCDFIKDNNIDFDSFALHETYDNQKPISRKKSQKDNVAIVVDKPVNNPFGDLFAKLGFNKNK